MILKKYQMLRKVGNSTKPVLQFWVNENGVVLEDGLELDQLRVLLQHSLQYTIYSAPTGQVYNDEIPGEMR